MVFPVEGPYVFENFLINSPVAEVDGDVLTVVSIFQELYNSLGWIPIELLDAGSRKGHCY